MKRKIQHAKELKEYGTMDVEKYVLLKDKKRANFYKQYTGKEFTDKHNYDIFQIRERYIFHFLE